MIRTYITCAALLAHASTPGWAEQPAQHSEDTCNAVATWAESAGLPVDLAVAMAYHESKLNMLARNPRSSARGPLQILGTWCKYGDCSTVEGTLDASVYALWWHLRRSGWDWRRGARDYTGVSVTGNGAHAADIYRTALWLESQHQCQCSRRTP